MVMKIRRIFDGNYGIIFNSHVIRRKQDIGIAFRVSLLAQLQH